MKTRTLLAAALLLPAANVFAIANTDTVSTKDLSNLCENYTATSKSVSHMKCAKYIKGVVQGLLLVSNNTAETAAAESSFSQRAMKVRLGDRYSNASDRTAQTNICVAQPYDWETIKDSVIARLPTYAMQESNAAETVYRIMQTRFSCS